MSNDSVNDRYNPPGIGKNDFEKVRFDELEAEELFWLNTNNGDNNPPYRKLNNTQGHDTRTGIVADFGIRQEVFQRT